MSTVEAQPEVQDNGHGAVGIPVENPATGETIATVPDMDSAQVKGLVDRARAAFPAWNELGFDGRAEVFYEMRRWMIENRDRVIGTIVDENGKPPDEAMLTELVYMADSLGFWAKNAPKYLGDERVRTHSPLLLGKKVIVRYRPYGVVGVIGPWNYPLSNNFGDALPALAAGNSVVLKPSEVTPLTSLLMEEGFRAAGGTPDAFLVATGRGETGAALVDHADAIMFTGSTGTGKKIMARAAETLTPVSLELGGKDPMIVLKDADLERAANMAVQWGMSNSGQICMSVERVYVEEPIYDEFVNKVVEKTKALRQGAPGAAGSVDVGAMTFPPQLEKVEAHVKDALDKGARVLTGGKRAEGPGRFYEPTVLVDVDHSMTCMTDETFGPTLPIMKVRDEDEAVRMANDSGYGLNSSVFTRDVQKGERIARQVEAGSTCVNDALMNYLAQEAPFAGMKGSGIGARHSAAGIRKFAQPQTILVTRFGPSKEPTMFPNSAKKAKLMEKAVVLMYGRKRKKKG
ncbi:MAG TPA: aldehyde dehydrogenase family protein [Thermoleophilaceae bacterium]|jgi:acyl-CoA reductase-like NAD-dependent aldehyde dehydrogenase